MTSPVDRMRQIRRSSINRSDILSELLLRTASSFRPLRTSRLAVANQSAFESTRRPIQV